jgi:hypothetical protein
MDALGARLYPHFTRRWRIEMSRLRSIAATALLGLSCGFWLIPAHAGVYGDNLTKCLIKSTTDADHVALVQWIFAMLSMHPQVQSMVTISDAQRNELNRKVAAILERLLTEQCRSETAQAVKFEGMPTLGPSFQALGKVAGTQLFSDPGVAAGMAEFTKYIDPAKFKGLLEKK